MRNVNSVAVGQRLFPAAIVPSGWYQIGWSGDFEAGGRPLPLDYFERNLVAFRGKSGRLHVLDAHCRHMGANLGHGGTVVGDEIACPYHGWRWSGADGSNTHIPYGNRDCMPKLSLGSWATREVDGVVLVWYGADGEPPAFALPERFYRSGGEPWDPFPEATSVWRDVTMAPQFAAENVPDAAHFKYIHRAARLPTLERYESGEGVFRTEWSLSFGEDRPPTWATPTGPIPGRIVTETYGLSLGWNVQYAFDEVTALAGYTPIDPYKSDIFLTVWTPRSRTDGSPLGRELRDHWFEFQKTQIEADIRVWSHQTYIEHPPYAILEGDSSVESVAMRAIRDWSEQFYGTGAQGSGEVASAFARKASAASAPNRP